MTMGNDNRTDMQPTMHRQKCKQIKWQCDAALPGCAHHWHANLSNTKPPIVALTIFAPAFFLGQTNSSFSRCTYLWCASPHASATHFGVSPSTNHPSMVVATWNAASVLQHLLHQPNWSCTKLILLGDQFLNWHHDLTKMLCSEMITALLARSTCMLLRAGQI